MIAPFYRDPLADLYYGDAIETIDALADAGILTPGCLAAVVTDPPYASGARTEAKKPSSGAMMRGQRWASKPIENDQMTTVGFVWLIRETLLALRPYLAEGGGVLAFIDWRQFPNLQGAVETCDLRVNGMVVWDKESMGLGNGFRAQHELILFGSKGTPRVVAHDVPNVLRFPRERDTTLHPSPKPIPLMKRLLSVVARPGDLILDPFGGSATTAVAAKESGIRSITIESQGGYCQTSADRLTQARLFDPPATFVQGSLEGEL